MDIQDARQIRDRESGLPRHHALAPQSGTTKHREIRFNPLLPQQAEAAWKLLGLLQGVAVVKAEDGRFGQFANSVSVWYEVTEHTLSSLEQALIAHGFTLENSLYCRLVRWWVAYFEETQLRSLSQPQRLLKKSNEIYSKAWERHAHGDHDDTPVELRKQ